MTDQLWKFLKYWLLIYLPIIDYAEIGFLFGVAILFFVWCYDAMYLPLKTNQWDPESRTSRNHQKANFYD